MEKIIEELDINLIEMRKTIPTVWEYRNAHFAHQLSQDLEFEQEMGHKRFVVADGKWIKIIYHLDVQKTELIISNSILPELDPSLQAHYQALLKTFNDCVVKIHNEIKKNSTN